MDPPELDDRGRKRDENLKALEHSERALALFRRPGIGPARAGEARALNAIGWSQIQLGRPTQALTVCREAIAILQEIGDRVNQAATWDSVGYAHQCLGEHERAVDCYRRALDLYQEFGSRYFQSAVLAHLGENYQAMGQRDNASKAWNEALDILTDLDHPDADDIRRRVAQLSGSAPAGSHPAPRYAEHSTVVDESELA